MKHTIVFVLAFAAVACAHFVNPLTAEHACPVDCGGGYCCAAYEECVNEPTRRCIPAWRTGLSSDAGADR